MKVTIRVFGELATVIGKKHVLNVTEGSNVLAVTNSIQEMAGQKKLGYLGKYKVDGADISIIVNGKNVALLDGVDTVLSDGDDVVIMPYVSGGEGRGQCNARVCELGERVLPHACDGRNLCFCTCKG